LLEKTDMFSGNPRTRFIAAALTMTAVGLTCILHADPVRVRYEEGSVHAFLKLSSMDGAALAAGDLVQKRSAGHMTTRLVFHFRDGSVHDESAVFDQRGTFTFVSGRLTQKGPAFPRAVDMTIDRANGRVSVHYTDDDGKAKTAEDSPKLTPDVANGLVPILLRNLDRDAAQTWLMVAATPKPRLVKLEVSGEGDDSLTIGGTPRKARHYVVKINIGGIAGVVAPLVGKKPPDTHVWILDGEVPTFVKSEGPLFFGGPIWRIELASPVWPASSRTENPTS